MIIKFSYLLIFLLIPLLIFSGCSSKKTKNSEGIIQISQENNQSNMIFPAYKYRRMVPPQTTGNRGARGQLPFCVVHENEGESIINGEKVKNPYSFVIDKPIPFLNSFSNKTMQQINEITDNYDIYYNIDMYMCCFLFIQVRDSPRGQITQVHKFLLAIRGVPPVGVLRQYYLCNLPFRAVPHL